MAGSWAAMNAFQASAGVADGPAVFLKTDFDENAPALAAVGQAAVRLVDGGEALAGRSLAVARQTADGSFGASTGGLTIDGSRNLRIAFTARTRGMRTVTVNLFDAARNDNSTPASPARMVDDEWRTVVFHVEDFHYNADSPDRKVGGSERFVSLLFHGTPVAQAPEVWIDRLVVYRGPDRQPPASPTDLTATANGSAVDLAWREPLDDTFAAVYSVHRQGSGGAWTKIAETQRTAWRDVVPAPGAYAYRVTAADYENNVSAPSSEARATASSGTPSPVAPTVVQDRLNYAAHVRAVHARGRGAVRPGVFLFAGDSITGAAVYTHVLGSWLARGQTVRQGVASVTSRYGRDHIEEYLRDAQPEFAVVMYGTNNQKGRRDVEAAMNDLAAVVDACVVRGTVPILATIPPRGYSSGQGDQERYNAALIALARARRVPVSYVFETMMQRDLRRMLYDGIHLTPDHGNDAAGEALRRTMDQVYFGLRE
jgi:hypothetical protein